MSQNATKRDLLDTISEFLAHRKGLPVFIAVFLAVIGLVLSCIPGLREASTFWGWLVKSQFLLYLAVILGLLGILLGDAL